MRASAKPSAEREHSDGEGNCCPAEKADQDNLRHNGDNVAYQAMTSQKHSGKAITCPAG